MKRFGEEGCLVAEAEWLMKDCRSSLLLWDVSSGRVGFGSNREYCLLRVLYTKSRVNCKLW